MKSKVNIIKNFKKKIQVLKKHNDLYFNHDEPLISDKEYDDLKKELIDLENKNTFLKDLNLFRVVDTADEAVEHLNNFYAKYQFKPNF